uniref:Uncharacterized protein n=1 Tax=Lactuca sativa TaxID=4236 RepID=A0A9R1XN66_LACSA|nr:hypothetical protein LSAT_V11C300129500 [Lactuca sativa]
MDIQDRELVNDWLMIIVYKERADMQKAVEKEFEMALQDRVMEETKDKKNAVESYVYEMRKKVTILLKGLMNQMLMVTSLTLESIRLDVNGNKFNTCVFVIHTD